MSRDHSNPHVTDGAELSLSPPGVGRRAAQGSMALGKTSHPPSQSSEPGDLAVEKNFSMTTQEPKSSMFDSN